MRKLYIFAVILITSVSFQSKAQPFLDHPVVEKVAGGFRFIEGPVWVDGLGLLFSDIPQNTIYLFSTDSVVSEYINPSGNSNGLALDAEGNLLICQHGPRQLSRREPNGDIVPLATHYENKRLNSPNDLAVKSDGSVFFTDPPYGLFDQGGTSELGFYGIYRLSPDGNVQLLDKSLARPNGICFSPDETRLYVNDSETRRIYVWDVVNDTTIANKKELGFMSPQGAADGMKVDKNGYLYVSGPIGIWIYSPEGNPVDTIPVPGQTANCGWNADSTMLYVTSGDALYRIKNVTESVSEIKEINAGTNHPDIFPNPVTDRMIINFTVNKPGEIEFLFINQSGQLAGKPFTRHFSNGYHTVNRDFSSFQSGIYYLVMKTEEGLFTTELLKK